jgi:hypothetical protein
MNIPNDTNSGLSNPTYVAYDPAHTGGFATAPGMASTHDLPATTSVIGSGWIDETQCQPGYDHGDWGKRDRTEGAKGQRAKAKRKNRKAAKAARKVRKHSK